MRSAMRASSNLVLWAAAALLTWAPRVAHACPMCFTGANSNAQAFVWGSVLLMLVPTTALGTLGYLAYRRIKAIEQSQAPRPPVTGEPPSEQPSALRPSGERPVLRVVPPT